MAEIMQNIRSSFQHCDIPAKISTLKLLVFLCSFRIIPFMYCITLFLGRLWGFSKTSYF